MLHKLFNVNIKNCKIPIKICLKKKKKSIFKEEEGNVYRCKVTAAECIKKQCKGVIEIGEHVMGQE